MNWILADLLMFFSSVVLYLTVRKSTIAKLPVVFNNLATFLIPMVLFVTAAFLRHGSYNLSLTNIAIIVVAGIFFAYLANVFSLKSIELTPNPGYSLMISKNYVVLTTFLAIPLFHQHVTPLALAAIFLIIFFSSLIGYNPAKSRRAKSHAWLPLALGAFLGWAFLSLVAKYLNQHGVPPIAFLACLFIVATTCILVEMIMKQISLRPFIQNAPSFLLIGLASASFNFFNFYAISIAPNIGYVNATNAASIGAVTIFAILLFKDEFSIKKLAGVVGCIGSLILLFAVK